MRKSKQPTGAVMVLGGGIAGIQSSLDLADSGFKVYLVEQTPSIGGTMAQLDKTFPTNDCSMCILSPKVVEAGRHLNIETMTWSVLDDVSGEAPHFKIRIRRLPRYVDMDKCTGCADCVEACPVSMPNEFDAGVGERKAIFRPYPQGFPATFLISKWKTSPCRTECPAGINTHGFIALTSQGKFAEALGLIRESTIFPGVLGRVCDHPCEQACKRGIYDEPISICSMKRFLSDQEISRGEETPAPPAPENKQDTKVAIIGAGPAGLSAAYHLANLGHGVTVFEALPEVGGMLRAGIPAYRLPREILDREIDPVRKAGAEIKTGVRIGQDLTVQQLQEQGYQAFLLAVGAHQGGKLGVDGEELDGMTDCVEFLRGVNMEGKKEVGRRVCVIGGGNAAIDAARVSLRLGAEKVTIVYRRSRAEMPAIPSEIEEAENEGVEIVYLASPVKLTGPDGKLTAMECIRMALGEPDASGRRRPVPIAGSEFTIETDCVIPAIGQTPQLEALSEQFGLKLTRWGTPKYNEATGATPVGGVFVAGDAATGPDTVVEAVGGGKLAATAIDSFLRTGKIGVSKPQTSVADDADESTHLGDTVEYAKRVRQTELAMDRRKTTFEEVEQGFDADAAIAEASRCIACGVCSECQACVKACKAEAICHDQTERIEEFEVGSIVLAPGFEEFEPGCKHEWGYDGLPNVVSSIEFERILSASGPYGGHVQRPSDGQPPKKVAFLQCAGSRDVSCRNDYCSSVCCMYAIKEAVIAKEHDANVEPTIFNMDIRAFGKDFDKYYERAQKEHGIRFVKARVSDIKENGNPGGLELIYETEDGTLTKEPFDMAVLAVGLEPPNRIRALTEQLGIRTNPFGFIRTKETSPLATSRPGIFVAGAAAGPKDIPETVCQASGAASAAGSMLAPARGTLTREAEYPPERDVTDEEVRVGIFICHCGINIAGTVDVAEVTEYAKTLPGVVFATDNLYTCSQDTQIRMRELIAEHNLNRVIVASCSPRTHEPLFQETLRQAGLNPHLFEMANIRDQCSWIHMGLPKEATEKAKDLVRMAAAKVLLVESLPKVTLPVMQKALVIGGGLAGIIAASDIAAQGFKVVLVEREDRLGGNLNRLKYTLEGTDVPEMLTDLTRRIQLDEHIQVRVGAEIKQIEGFVGNYKTTVTSDDGEEEFEHGAVVVAVGGSESKPTEYGYGKDDRIMTQLELEEVVAGWNGKQPKPKSVVMIQCVGSRDDEHPYCSRVCCGDAVKNAIRIKKASPDTEITILYRDMRTYGFMESFYQQARELGVLFIRFDPEEEKPQVSKNNGQLRVEFTDKQAGARLALDPDLLVLSSRIDPVADGEDISQMLKVPRNEDGFFLEAHVKLRPVEFATEGVFLAGLCHAPKAISETIAQARAAAAKTCRLISKDFYEAEPTIAAVNEDLCDGCGICVPVCDYSAIEVVDRPGGKEGEKIVRLNEAMCKGCGACVAACPSGAMEQKGFKNEQMLAMIDALLVS